jgi:hypothetical protein
MSASLEELLTVDRHWEFTATPDKARWRGLIYGPDGRTVSYASSARSTIEDACHELVRLWQWHLSLAE